MVGVKASKLVTLSALLASTPLYAQEQPIITTFGDTSSGAALYSRNGYVPSATYGGYPVGYPVPGYPVGYPGFPPAMTPPSVTDPQQTIGLTQGKTPNDLGTTFGSAPANVIDQSPPTADRSGVEELGQPATSGVYAGGTYTMSEIADVNSGFYTGRRTILRTNNVRTNAIIQAAEGVGIKAGFAAEAQRLENAIGRHSAKMNDQFNFASLMTENGLVVPPVITEVRSISEQRGSTLVYTTTGAYEIASDAYVSIRAPHWRDYLTIQAAAPTPPSGIRVETSEDKKSWREAAERGWNRGVSEARAAFTAGLDRMIRDYRGMQRYHELVAAGAVSLAKVKISQRNGAVYANGALATGREVTVKLTVIPRFRSPAAVARSLDTFPAAPEAIPQPTASKPATKSAPAKASQKTASKAAKPSDSNAVERSPLKPLELTDLTVSKP